jgi:2'-5' RNA ligase
MLGLYRHVADRLIQCRVELDQRPYHPHLTLGRWRDSRAADRPRESSAPEEIASVEVADVALFESRLSSSGATHSRLATARLTWR